MDIGIIRRRYDPNGGGAERYAARVIDGLIQKGHQVTLYAEKFSNVPAELELVEIPRTKLSLCKTQSFAENAQKALCNHAHDITYALSRYLGADIYRQAEQVHKIWMPIYYSNLEKLNPRHRGILKLEEQLFKKENTKRVVTNSTLVKSQIFNHFQYPKDQIIVIQNGVCSQTFYPASFEEKQRLTKKSKLDKSVQLLFVADNFAIKGLHSLIIALTNLKSPLKDRIKLTIIGGDESSPYLKKIGNSGLSDQIFFKGKVSKDELRSYYCLSDLFVYPSLYEPFANVCLEAAACGLPIITTRSNGACEIVAEEKGGYLIDKADDIDELTNSIEKFAQLEDKDKEKMKKFIYQSSQAYRWGKHIDELEALMLNYLEESKNAN